MLFGHLCWSWQVTLFLSISLLGCLGFAFAFILHKRSGIARLRAISNLALVGTVCTGVALMIGLANVTCGVESIRIPGDFIAVCSTGIALFVFGVTSSYCDEVRFGNPPARLGNGLTHRLSVGAAAAAFHAVIICGVTLASAL